MSQSEIPQGPVVPVSDEEIVRQVGPYFFAPEDMDAKAAVVRAVRDRLAPSPVVRDILEAAIDGVNLSVRERADLASWLASVAQPSVPAAE